MTDATWIVEQLINRDGVHAFVLICEAVDKYLSTIESLGIPLENGQMFKVTQLEPGVAQKVEETRKVLRREDRIMWALRHYKKSLIAELLWLAKNDPAYIQKKTGSLPSSDLTYLERQFQRLSDVDITPFQENDPDDPEITAPPYAGYVTIDTINDQLGRYFERAERYGNEPDNIIIRLVFQRQSFGEILSLFRKGLLAMHKRYGASIHIWHEPSAAGDMRDDEGPVETIVDFPGEGWKWINLHRNCSRIRNDPSMAGSSMAITGHCGNTVDKGNVDCLELVQPLGNDRWRDHAFFVLDKSTGALGEMKGRSNQRPSSLLWKYIYELLRQYRRITGLVGAGYKPNCNFHLKDLPKHYLDILRQERPELFTNSVRNQLPDPEPVPDPVPEGAPNLDIQV